MGYETTFKLKEGVKLDSKFVSYGNGNKNYEEDVKMYEAVLGAFCTNMACENTFIDLNKAYKDIKFAVRLYVSVVADEWKAHLKTALESEDGKLFCGWNHARGGASFTWESDDDVANFFTKELFSKAIVNTECGPFDKDNDAYYAKSESINETIGEIEDCVWDAMDHMFIERYRDSDDAIERGDDNNWGEPEEDEDKEGDPLTIEPTEDPEMLASLETLKKCLREHKSKKSDDEDKDGSTLTLDPTKDVEYLNKWAESKDKNEEE